MIAATAINLPSVTPGLLTPDLKERWDTDGWCVVPGAIPPPELAAAQEAVHRYFPTPAEMAARGGAEAGQWHTWDAPWPEFPFHSSRLNALVLHDNVIDLAEGLLGTADLALYMGTVTAKYAHQASGYNQLLHADYPNHMLVVPRHELGYQQVEFFVYLTDVTLEDGATRFVSWQKTKDIPVERHTLNYVDYADLYDDPGGRGGTGRLHRRLPTRRVPPFGGLRRPDALPDHAPRLVPPPRRRVGRLPGLALPGLLVRAEQVRPAGHAAPARPHGRARARPPLLERSHAGRRAGPLPRARHVALARGAGRAVRPGPRCGEPGATMGQGISRSATSARSSSSCSRWCPASTCRPTGNPSTSPAGMLMAGLPLRFDGAVSAALFMMARTKPTSWIRSCPGDRRRRRPLGREGDVGIGRAQDEVRLVEQVRHGLVELAPIALDRGRPLEVVALPGAASSPAAHLAGQLVDPLGIRIAQVGHERGLIRHRPLPAQRWQRRRHRDDAAAPPPRPGVRPRRHQVRHLVAHAGDPEVRKDGHGHAGQVVASPARPPTRPRRAG